MTDRRWLQIWWGSCLLIGIGLIVLMMAVEGWRDRQYVQRPNVQALLKWQEVSQREMGALADQLAKAEAATGEALTKLDFAVRRAKEEREGVKATIRYAQEERDIARAVAAACGRLTR